jgi:hypothetical protein
LISRRRRNKKKEEEEEEDTLPSSANFKLHIGYIRDNRNIILLHKPLLKEDFDIENKKEEEDTLPSFAKFKLQIGYTRDIRIINLLHRSLLKEDLDIEKKGEKERRIRRRYFAKLCRFQTPHWVHKRQQDHQPSSQILIERRP